MHRFVLPADPQSYNVRPTSDSVPTIQVDLASPESPDTFNVVNDFQQGGKHRKEEDPGLMMKPPSSGPNKSGDKDEAREQKLTRCLSDPGPGAEEDEDEDEPFLPWDGDQTRSDHMSAFTVQSGEGCVEVISLVQKPKYKIKNKKAKTANAVGNENSKKTEEPEEGKKKSHFFIIIIIVIALYLDRRVKISFCLREKLV